MTAADLVLLFAVTLGGVASLGAFVAVLLLWFRGSLRKVAALLAGAGAVALGLLIVSRLSPDALAMAVGVVFGLLAFVPALLIVRAGADPHSRAHACDPWADDRYLDSTQPAGFLDDWEYQTERTRTVDESGLVCEESFTLLVPKRRGVVTVERANHRQLTGGK